MKMKSIFLSMLAIAALASCSKEEENPSPPVPQGEKMVVELTIGSGSLSTKAAGTATNDNDKTITDLTVFGVNPTSGAVVTKKYFNNLTDATGGKKKVNFETTDQTKGIYVIANIGKDLTTGSEELNVQTFKELQNAKASLIVTTPSNQPSQTEGKVLMSGSTSTITGTIGGSTPATASVSLGFIASKIILKSLKRGAGSTGTYGSDFEFKNAILTNVQTSAYYLVDQSSFIGAITGDVRPAITKTWATGLTGQTDTEVADFKQTLTITDFAPDATATQDIAYWYVFENDEAIGGSGKPTTLLIHYLWKETVGSTMTKEMYFPITFHTNDGGAIEPGKAYNVSLTFNGNFSPGGTGGGGTPDPDTPIVPGSVDVEVTPASWTDQAADKPFN